MKGSDSFMDYLILFPKCYISIRFWIENFSFIMYAKKSIYLFSYKLVFKFCWMPMLSPFYVQEYIASERVKNTVTNVLEPIRFTIFKFYNNIRNPKSLGNKKKLIYWERKVVNTVIDIVNCSLVLVSKDGITKKKYFFVRCQGIQLYPCRCR